MEYQFKLVSGLEKVFFDWPDELPAFQAGSMLKNEVYSFQMVGWTGGHQQAKVKCRLEIESELRAYLSVMQVGYVPCTVPSIAGNDDDDYITKRPGLFPDPLYRLQDQIIPLANDQARAFWIVLEPKGRVSGTFPIFFRILDEEGNLLETLTCSITIIDAELPKQQLINTGWLHMDCLALVHHAEPLSDAHFQLLEKYLEVYTKFGHNMILTPVFTPPLDTAVGKERLTVQLVDVTVQNGQYRFGFEKLEKWISICRKYGIEYFEICHLFTQWGLKATPKIMAEVDGTYQKLFGWETDALSEEYCAFLNDFMAALIGFLRALGVEQNCYFHISDEPSTADLNRYRKAKEIMCQFVPNERLIDALGNFEFYQEGVVTKPVVATNQVQPFLEHHVERLWVYYCTAQGKDVSNRFFAMPSYRNRILGYQLYKYQIEGFLQWGFNFWLAQLSTHAVDPYADTDAGGGFQSGDPFLVYPLDYNGEVVCSLRLYVFHEALQDMRALELLESYIGRNAVMKYLDDFEGFTHYPKGSDKLLALREKINQEIKRCVEKQ